MIPGVFTRSLRVIFGLLTLAALVRQLTIHLAMGLPAGNFFSYYTILSNLFAGCVLLLVAAIGTTDRRAETLRFISVVNMTMVGTVFVTLLREVDLGSLRPWINFVHHYLMPVVMLTDFLLVPPRCRLAKRDVLIALAFPLVYLIYSLIRGQMTGWYPYPFLNANVVGGIGGLVLYVAGITLVFGVVASALRFISNRRLRP